MQLQSPSLRRLAGALRDWSAGWQAHAPTRVVHLNGRATLRAERPGMGMVALDLPDAEYDEDGWFPLDGLGVPVIRPAPQCRHWSATPGPIPHCPREATTLRVPAADLRAALLGVAWAADRNGYARHPELRGVALIRSTLGVPIAVATDCRTLAWMPLTSLAITGGVPADTPPPIIPTAACEFLIRFLAGRSDRVTIRSCDNIRMGTGVAPAIWVECGPLRMYFRGCGSKFPDVFSVVPQVWTGETTVDLGAAAEAWKTADGLRPFGSGYLGNQRMNPVAWIGDRLFVTRDSGEHSPIDQPAGGGLPSPTGDAPMHVFPRPVIEALSAVEKPHPRALVTFRAAPDLRDGNGGWYLLVMNGQVSVLTLTDDRH